MEEIVCKNCGLVNDYRFEFRSGHKCAWCNGCGKYIKNIAHSTPRFYFGKYKDVLISECTDIPYMQWIIGANVAKGNIKAAIIERVAFLEKGVNNG